jgi:hypothetical protein
MSKSIRIRTEVGVDKYVNVNLEQDFDFLEILSLKVLQSEVYTRRCSDYGVVVGRVTVNDGFGVPNAKVSIFIPLSQQDELNPVISALYPYKCLNDLNDEGYRYNLLPYTKSYSQHVPTGTFFDKEDILINPTYIEVFDKYYKFTARTNDSGDFMIMGTPIGTQAVHFDIDLSDIGEFSLSPQDLIRMGAASEAQVAGTSFRASTNLNELPQIISINKKIEIQPFWGQEEVCSVGISRLDIDLTAEKSLNITPTAIFMGSLISSNDDQFQKRNCKPKLRQGELCNLVTGPGQILAIRQTISQDINGRPGLEVYELEQGGQVIDENGTWLVDVPMNLDYVITNEFGERVLSNDPKKGIPTKGKYRFKVKWNQSPKLAETLKRGYFLVPNIREYGWIQPDVDPLIDLPNNDPQRLLALKSYSFSLDWTEYADIQAAINCEDTFYLMTYNKVYTVSQMIDQFRAGYLPDRTISIKNILDQSCESENVKFPTNDAVARFDLVYLLFVISLYIFKPILYVLLIVMHILAFFLMLIGPILAIIVGVVYGIIILICNAVSLLCFGCLSCPPAEDIIDLMLKILKLYEFFTNLPIPNLTYPDCELCNCGDPQLQPPSDAASIVAQTTGTNIEEIYQNSSINSYLSPFTVGALYTGVTNSDIETESKLQQLLSGKGLDADNPSVTNIVPNYFSKDGNYYFTQSLTLPERLNLFNVKAKYFDDVSGNNPGGGYNRIKVSFSPTLNPGSNKFHYDNVVALSCLPDKLSELVPGQIVSFQDSTMSADPNLTGLTSLNIYGSSSVTGTTVNDGTNSFTVRFAHPNGTNVYTATTYNINQVANDSVFNKFPVDIEYYQVITAMTYTEFVSNCTGTDPLTLNNRYISNTSVINKTNAAGVWDSFINYNPYSYFKEYENQVIVFLVRGVDPYSSRGEVSYDLSKLFGHNWGTTVITDNVYKLNIPIQGSYKSVKHNNFQTNLTIPDSNNHQLYYDSYHYEPGNQFSGFTTTLPKYYSALDESKPSYSSGIIFETSQPTTQLSSMVDTTSASLGYRINFGTYISDSYQNGFSYTYDAFVNTWTPTQNDITTQSSQNRGYFRGEIIDGGSLMFQGPSNITFSPPQNVPYLTSQFGVDGGIFTPIFIGYYYAPTYDGAIFNYPQDKGASGRQIVMRSDRLPTSTTTTKVGNNSYPLHTNNRFSVYLFSDEGTVTTSQNTGQALPTFSNPGDSAESGLLLGSTNVINTFQCSTLVPLGCYDPNGTEISVYPPDNPCYTNGVDSKKIMKNGCYILVTRIFETLVNGKDFQLLTEWASRIQISFGACRNVWGHMFTNNWINGTLYAFSFKNERFFTSPFRVPLSSANQPFSVYCRKTLILHPTNNFYYRSSPYKSSTNSFIGAPRLIPFFSSLFGAYGGNIRHLNFPTTMMDLGPRSQYLQELVMSDDFDGYVVNQLKSTTYTDVSEILNLLIVSRLVNTNFIQQLLGIDGASIDTYFNKRNKLFVDGDYAQMLSISSELGISDFEGENYPPRAGQDPIYFNDADSEDAIFGIFFSSDTQVRDFISPKRTIISEITNIEDDCTFTYFSVFTQRVPFYQWNIDANEKVSNDSIFGSQKNDWFTDYIDGSKFFDYRYQKMDRAEIASRYFRSNNSLQSINFKGYIYQQDINGEYSPTTSTIQLNNPRGRTMSVGAPFHFYFGLKKGKTAWDRFAAKWINFDVITD